MIERVKGTRQYDSSSRLAQARASRLAILDAAERQFLHDGFGATTIAGIAREAGVSVETVYKAFGGKSGLVRALYDRGLEGRGPVAAEQRSDEMRERETDPRTIMRNWGTLAAEVSSVIIPIRLLIRSAAATDPDMAAILVTSDEQRLTRMRHHAQFLADRGYLRQGVTPDQAADILWHCSSAELYEILVLRRHWSLTQFGQFVTEFMITALLPQ
jgi:AcrR family transcriptional regulator